MSTLSMTTPGNHGWIGYAGKDPAAAKTFYSDVIGWTIAEIPMQDGSSHSAIMVGDARSAASWRPRRKKPPGWST